MKFLGALIVAAALAAGSSAMAQQPIPFVNSQQLQIPATGVDFNNLILAIDNLLNPIFPTVPGATSGIAITEGTGTTAISATGPVGTDVSLQLSPQNNGNIILFKGNVSPVQSGVIQVANSPSWLPMQGLVACPGVVGNKSQIGMDDHITGYLVIMDWIGVKRGIPSC